MVALEPHPQGVILPVTARAGGRVNGVTGVRQGMLLVSVTAAAEKGKANQAIVDVLAKVLGCGKRQIELTKGATSPAKRFLLAGLDPAHVEQQIAAALAE